MVPDDEKTLIARSRNGDWEAFGTLIQNNQRMIHSLAYRMSGSQADAEDLAQETFVAAYRGLPTYRGDARFSSWLYRIAINQCIRWRKTERRRGVTDRDWMAADVGSVSHDNHGERVQEALNLLPAKQRAAVVLTLFDDMTHAQAAQILGCAETTLSWRLFAARRRLAVILKKGDPAP
jgi:RNA polymerase sigma-70 factor (ECF subfamily)